CKKALAGAAFCILLSWAYRLAALALGAEGQEELLLSYTAPTMLVCGIAMLALFAGRRLPAQLAKAAAFLSPLTFGVYLIHDHPLVREYLIKMRLTVLANLNPVWMLAALFACWAGVYAVCLLIEWLRTRLFSLLRVPALCERMEKRLCQWTDRLFPEADA
ncbi:MAG: hypothetical protein IKK75_10570, partial [Clostridia bacterium]|nr:hypothetical protein [Clostridia bacterium]